MVNLVVLGLLATAAVPSGVLQRGHCLVSTASSAQNRGPGTVLFAGERLSTGPEQWAEVSLSGGLRLRLSAATSVSIRAQGDRLQMSEGRLWLQRDGALRESLWVEVPGLKIEVPPRTSLVIEHTRSGGSFVMVRAGRAVLHEANHHIEIGVGRAFRRALGERRLRAPQAGGGALGDLVAEEARRALGDPSNLQQFLQSHIRGPEGFVFALHGQIWGEAEVMGADAGPAGALVEAGLRPPPFFEEEVPTKGPNLDVRVVFP